MPALERRLGRIRCNEPEARHADAEYLAELPALPKLPDWWIHPPDPDHKHWVSWSSQSIVLVKPQGRVEYLIHARTAQPAAERLYEALYEILQSDRN